MYTKKKRLLERRIKCGGSALTPPPPHGKINRKYNNIAAAPTSIERECCIYTRLASPLGVKSTKRLSLLPLLTRTSSSR